MTVTRIHLRDHVLDIRATADTIDITDHTPAAAPLPVRAGPGRKLNIIAP
jgi:hypothetical protein